MSGDDRLMLVRQRTLWSADRAIGVKLGERAGDAPWRSARLSERGEGRGLPPWPRLAAPGRSP